MSPGTNMIVITFLCTMVGFKTDIYYRYPVVFILYYGILTAKITNKLIVATMTKSELRLTDPSLWSLVVLLLNQYYRLGLFLPAEVLYQVLYQFPCMLYRSTAAAAGHAAAALVLILELIQFCL